MAGVSSLHYISHETQLMLLIHSTRQQQPKRIRHTDTVVALSPVWSLTDRDVSSRSIRHCVFIETVPPAESRGDEEESLLTRGMEMEPATTLQRMFTPSAAVGGVTCLSACWLARSRWSEVPYKEDLGGLEKTLMEVEAVQEGFSFRWVLVNLIKRLTLLLHYSWLWFLL